MLLITLLGFTALGYVNYQKAKYFLHPSVIFSAIWAFQIVGLLIFESNFIPISTEAFFVIALGALSFSIGTHLQIFHLPDNESLIKERTVWVGYTAISVAAAIVAVCVYGQNELFSSLNRSQDFSTNLVYARVLMSIENEDFYGLYKYGTPLAFGSLIALEILIIKKLATRVHIVFFLYFLMASIIMGIFSTGRGPIVFIALVLGLTYLLSKSTRQVGGHFVVIAISVGALLFLVFWIMGVAMGKSDDDAAYALDELISYLFSAIPALSAYLTNAEIPIFGGDLGVNSFRFFSALSAAIGWGDQPASLVQDFVPVPHLTNLYTIYFHYLRDFGWLGVVFIPLLIGTLHGGLFRWSMNNPSDHFALYLLAFSYLPLIQTVFQETHLTLVSTWIQLGIIGFLITRPNLSLSRKKLYV